MEYVSSTDDSDVCVSVAKKRTFYLFIFFKNLITTTTKHTHTAHAL